MNGTKHVVKFARTTNTSGETINEAAQSPMSDDRNSFSKANVIIDLQTLTGTSVTVSVLESFGGVFVETAKTAALTGTGQYVLCQHADPNANVTKNVGPFPALGSGMNKQIVTTTSGLSAITCDFYFAFFR